MHLREREETAFYLLHDRDAKYTAKFDRIFKSERTAPVRLPVRPPNLNAYAESWLGSLKRECLNHFLVLGERPHQEARLFTRGTHPCAYLTCAKKGSNVSAEKIGLPLRARPSDSVVLGENDR